MFRARGLEETIELLCDSYLKGHCPKEREKRRNLRKETKAKNEARSKKKITRSERDTLLARDGHRCTFKTSDGMRCDETDDLQVDHRIPQALGGTNDSSNLRTLCRSHNLLMAEQVLGKGKMQQYYKTGKRARS